MNPFNSNSPGNAVATCNLINSIGIVAIGTLYAGSGLYRLYC
jgi:hypothetical protein